MKNKVDAKPSQRANESLTDPEKTIATLNQEIDGLLLQMAHMASTAAFNERIWRQFADIERALFRTRDLGRLVEDLLREITLRFELDQVVLLLCHPEVCENFFPDLSPAGLALGEGNWLLPFPGDLDGAFDRKNPKPILMGSEGLQDILSHLPESVGSVQSGVLIPLSIHEILFGGLFLGSEDPARYQPQDATDLLEYLGIKIALCMDNCLAYERVRHFGTTDSVTGLLNYFEIHSILEREFRRARRTGSNLSVLAIDFNFVQEHGSCNVANEVLKHAAALLRETLPSGETYLARYGSSEFLAVLPDVPRDEVLEVVPYLTQVIRKAPFKHQNTVILIQPIMGVGSCEEHTSCHQDLLDMAYSDLYHKKLSQAQPSSF